MWHFVVVAEHDTLPPPYVYVTSGLRPQLIGITLDFAEPMVSPSFSRRHWLTIEMAACYLTFSSLLPLAQPLKPVIGEFADVLGITAFFWPYPVFLALQTWLAESLWLWFLLILAGLGLVMAFAVLLRWSFHAFLEPTWWARLSAAVLWYVPLLVSQAILMLIIWSLGYPIGE
jgi:hypothetical protein